MMNLSSVAFEYKNNDEICDGMTGITYMMVTISINSCS